MSCSTTSKTVPVQCPNCLHEGPSFRHLLGQRARCKMCNHVFQMPRHVRIPCPGCGAHLRVSPEMLDLDVVCKFCKEPFRACLDQPDVSRSFFSGECTAIGATADRRIMAAVRPTIKQELETARAELLQMQQQGLEHAQRVSALEEALLRILSEQGALQSELQRLRSERETLLEQSRVEIESLRTQLKFLEEQRLVVAPALAARPSAASQAIPQLQPSIARNQARENGNCRIFSTRPPHKPSPGGNSKTGPHGGRTVLRDAIDRISHCESKADQLVAQLKTAQQEREFERQNFEKVLERLLGELTRAKSEFDVARGSSKPPADLPSDSKDDQRQFAEILSPVI